MAEGAVERAPARGVVVVGEEGRRHERVLPTRAGLAAQVRAVVVGVRGLVDVKGRGEQALLGPLLVLPSGLRRVAQPFLLVLELKE